MIESIIAVKPGAGRDVMLALCSSLSSERVVLEVASTNEKAIRLYEKLGFLKNAEISRWYDVLTRKNT
jgi:ribosomal protein S18 acetylase RimI-like enzyme